MPLERDEVFCPNREALRAWLSDHHSQTAGIWAIFYKKSTRLSDLSWDELVEECLCFGWIDSLPGKVDELRTKIYICPRKPNSGWSRRNKLLLIDLEAKGLMAPSGQAAVQRAKDNGSWERFDLAEDLVLPSDLVSALDSDGIFKDAWNKLTDAKKRQFLQQVYDGKSQATRDKKIASIRESICS